MVLDGNDYPASMLLRIADDLLQGEIALAGKDRKTAIAQVHGGGRGAGHASLYRAALLVLSDAAVAKAWQQ